MTTVPRAISGPEMGTMRALRMAYVPRGPGAGLKDPSCARSFEFRGSSFERRAVKRRTRPQLETRNSNLETLTFLTWPSLRHHRLRRPLPLALPLPRRLIRRRALQLRALPLDRLPHRQVALLVEEDLAVDERRLDVGVNAQRVAVPDREVGVLTDLDRPDAVLNAELHGAVVRDRLQRLL